MKQSAVVLLFSIAILAMVNLFACSSAYVNPQQNDFFTPVEKLPPKNPIPDSLAAGGVRNTADTRDRLKDSLLVFYQHQTMRLNDLNRQLDLFTRNEQRDSSGSVESLDEHLPENGQLSSELLLEKIRNQNQQLNDILEKLRSLSLKRQDKIGSGAAVPSPAPQQDPMPVAAVSTVPARAVHPQPSAAPKKNATTLTYGKAIQLYNDRQYEKAVKAFEQLLNQKIEPALADRYHFWRGVCFINLNKGKCAIREFKNVLRTEKSEKAEEAHFMIGQCYERMGEHASARTSFETMLRLYPNGNLRQVAEKKLTLLK